ncbi:MAG: transposase [Bacteroidales bacterium]|nr:transposase [Bacteroidales bacterium]
MTKYRSKLDSGKYYHVFNHAFGKENIFIEDKNYLYFLKKFEAFLSIYVDTFAYCLMPNHFHFLIRVNESDQYNSNQLSRAFKSFFTSYTNSFNKTYNKWGSLFQPRFKRLLIENNEQLLTTAIYIHCNPVKHSFVDSPIEWEFSSYNSIIENKSNTWLNTKEIISWFDNIENFMYCHEKYLNDLEINRIDY